MFIGHYGLAFGAKGAARRTSLGTLFLASEFVDLLWPVLLALGVERVAIDPGNTAFTPLAFEHYPWSHSLLAVGLWGLATAVVYGFATSYRKGALVVGALVVSHWLLDALTHRPDLPLVPGGEARIGLGLWDSIPWSVAVEIGLFGLGVWIYLRVTRAADRTGSLALWGLVAFLLVTYFGNIFGPPPPSVAALTWVAHSQWLLVLWGYWVDAHRCAR